MMDFIVKDVSETTKTTKNADGDLVHTKKHRTSLENANDDKLIVLELDDCSFSVGDEVELTITDKQTKLEKKKGVR